MNYSKILAFIIALFQAPIVVGAAVSAATESEDRSVVIKVKRHIKAEVGSVIALDHVEDEAALVVHTPSASGKKRRTRSIGEGTFAEVYSTREMVNKGLLAIQIPFSEMSLSEFSVLRERVSRGLLKVEIPLVTGPFVEPVDLLRRLVEGYLRAANMYYEGCRVSENKGVAFYYFKSAARKGSSRGIFHTALMLDLGDGVPMDKVGAANLYSLAIRRGHPVAPFNLGLMLLNNEVGESYPGETIQFTIFLAEKGVPHAQEILHRMGIPWGGTIINGIKTAL